MTSVASIEIGKYIESRVYGVCPRVPHDRYQTAVCGVREKGPKTVASTAASVPASKWTYSFALGIDLSSVASRAMLSPAGGKSVSTWSRGVIENPH